MESNLLLGAAALSGISALGHSQVGFEIIPPIRHEQKSLRAMRAIWHQGSAWFLFCALQLLRWSRAGGVPKDRIDRASYLLISAVDAVYFVFYVRLGLRTPLLAYGGRFALMATALLSRA